MLLLFLLLSYEIKKVFSEDIVLKWQRKPHFGKTMALKIPNKLNSRFCQGGSGKGKSGLLLKSENFLVLNQGDTLMKDNSMRLLLYSPPREFVQDMEFLKFNIGQCVIVFRGEEDG